MKMSVVAIKDLGSQLFARPYFVPHTNQAIRSFMDEVNRKPEPGGQNDLYSHPDDFELYDLGFYDDTKGSFEQYPDGPKLLQQAKMLKQS